MSFMNSAGLYGEGIAVIDGDLRFVHVNHALAKYHDRAPEDIVAMKVETLLPKQIWEIVAPPLSIRAGDAAAGDRI